MLTEAINSRMDAYPSAIRLCARTPLGLRNFGPTDLPLGQTRTSVLYSRAGSISIYSLISTHAFARQYWNENKPAELAPSGSLRGAEKENFEPPEWDF